MANVRRVNDQKFKNMLRNTRRADGDRLEVGIFKNARARRSAVPGSGANSLAYRYAIHDQGRGRNPRRQTLVPGVNQALAQDPFVRDFFSFNLARTGRFFTKVVNRAGVRIAAIVKTRITRLRRPPKTEATLNAIARRYGFRRSNPLIVTGEMRNAVNARYRRGT